MSNLTAIVLVAHFSKYFSYLFFELTFLVHQKLLASNNHVLFIIMTPELSPLPNTDILPVLVSSACIISVPAYNSNGGKIITI